MVAVANTIIHDITMVIKPFDAPSASAAVDTGRRPKATTEEAKVVEVAVFL